MRCSDVVLIDLGGRGLERPWLVGDLYAPMYEHTGAITAALADRYAIERSIGRGGMATVFLARDLKHDRPVAVKVLNPELAASIGPSRFLREIRIAAKLTHPSILPLHDSGQAGAFLYYVMPYVEGESLAARLRRDVQLPVDEVLAITQAVAAGLDYAHAQGVIHRDIKPDNILFNAGTAVLTDFGIAKAVSAAGGERLTETGMVLGTPAYMSPEQAGAEAHIDGRSDIYSLACVVYEMLTGQPPFGGPNVQSILLRHMTDPVLSLRTVRPSLSEAIERAVMRSLSKVPMDRFATAGAFAEALAAAEAPASRDVPTIAVLPFANLSPDPVDAYFSDGLTAEIISDLSQIASLRVISRTSVMQFKGTDKDIRTIGRELHARYLLEGSVQRAGDSLRITAQLVDASSDTQMWSDKFSGGMKDVFDIQEQVSTAIARALRLQLTAEESDAIAARPIANVHAYERYLRARNDIWRFTEEAIVHALHYLQDALETVGDNVLLYAAIAEAYYVFPHIGGNEPDACLERVKECATKIFELEPESPYGHWFHGLLQWKQRGGAQEGVRHLKRALQLQPNDVAILQWYGFFSATAGQCSASETCVQKLFELDPLSPLSHRNRGWLQLMQCRADSALDSLHRAYQMDSGNPQLRLLYLYALACNQRFDDACALAARMIKDTPNNVWTWIGRFYCNALQGERRKALRGVTEKFQQAARWGESYSFHVAECYALLDERTLALEWLENATSRGFINYPFLAEGAPFLANVRSEPRFQTLLARVKSEWERFEA